MVPLPAAPVDLQVEASVAQPEVPGESVLHQMLAVQVTHQVAVELAPRITPPSIVTDLYEWTMCGRDMIMATAPP